MHTGAVTDRQGCQVQKLEFQVTELTNLGKGN